MKVETLEMLTLSKFVIMGRLKADAKRAKSIDSMIDFVDSALELTKHRLKANVSVSFAPGHLLTAMT